MRSCMSDLKKRVLISPRTHEIADPTDTASKDGKEIDLGVHWVNPHAN